MQVTAILYGLALGFGLACLAAYRNSPKGVLAATLYITAGIVAYLWATGG